MRNYMKACARARPISTRPLPSTQPHASHPLLEQRWERLDRHYNWSSVVASDLFGFTKSVRIGDGSCLHGNGECRAHKHPWPGLGGAAATLPPGVVVVPIQRAGSGRASCGLHTPRLWMSSLLPSTSHADLVALFLRAARSIRFRAAAALPPDIKKRVVIHARRGDKIGLGFNSEAMLAKIYDAVEVRTFHIVIECFTNLVIT